MNNEPIIVPRLHQNMTLFLKRPALELSNCSKQIQAKNKETTKDIIHASEPKPFLSRSESGNIINLTLPLKKFEDGTEAISYKEGFINGEPPTSGCCLTNYHIIYRRLKANIPAHENYKGLVLQKSSTGKWLIYDPISNSVISPIQNTIYCFVTMPDKTIRIAACAQGVHSLISNLAPYVRYAGEIQFDDQQNIKTWNNKSGSYQSEASLSHQAGLDNSNFYDYLNHKKNSVKISRS